MPTYRFRDMNSGEEFDPLVHLALIILLIRPRDRSLLDRVEDAVRKEAVSCPVPFLHLSLRLLGAEKLYDEALVVPELEHQVQLHAATTVARHVVQREGVVHILALVAIE